MLDTIKNCIETLPCIDFDSYFMDYVMYVQDKSIGIEISQFLRNNSVDTRGLVSTIIDESSKLNSL